MNAHEYIPFSSGMRFFDRCPYFLQRIERHFTPGVRSQTLAAYIQLNQIGSFLEQASYGSPNRILAIGKNRETGNMDMIRMQIDKASGCGNLGSIGQHPGPDNQP